MGRDELRYIHRHMQGCVEGLIEKHCRDVSWGVSKGVCKGMGQWGGPVLWPPEQAHTNGTGIIIVGCM